ncbi:hypothetical protein BC831DRAFT_471000 [Entophlyctis helioformis]|nr:hypothetical protein BC831DRAFT_471000 [Entophlyctis helioformis]
MPKVIYSLGRQQHDEDADSGQQLKSFPKKTRTALLELQVASQNHNHKKELALLLDLSDIFVQTEDWGMAVDYSKRLLLKARYLKNPEAEMKALEWLAESYRCLDEIDPAITFQEKCVELASKHGTQEDQLDALLAMSVLYLKRGEQDLEDGFHVDLPEDFERVNSILAKATKLVSNATDLSSEQVINAKAQIIMNIGIVSKYQGNHAKAIEAIRRALTVFINQGWLEEQANAYCNLALCYEYVNDYKLALKFGQQEEKIHEEMGDTPSMLISMWENGLRLRKLHLFDEAKSLLERYDALREAQEDIRRIAAVKALASEIASALSRSATEPRSVFFKHGERAKLLCELGMPAEAIKDLEAQRSIAMRLKMPIQQITTVSKQLGEVYLGVSRFADAEACFRDVLRQLGNDSDNQSLLDVTRLLARTIWMSKDGRSYEQLVGAYERFHDLAKRARDQQAQLEAVRQLERIHLRYGYTERAKVCHAQIPRLTSLSMPSPPSADPSMETDDHSETSGSNSQVALWKTGKNMPSARAAGNSSSTKSGAAPRVQAQPHTIKDLCDNDDAGLPPRVSTRPSRHSSREMPRPNVKSPAKRASGVIVIASSESDGVSDSDTTVTLEPEARANLGKRPIQDDKDSQSTSSSISGSIQRSIAKHRRRAQGSDRNRLGFSSDSSSTHSQEGPFLEDSNLDGKAAASTPPLPRDPSIVTVQIAEWPYGTPKTVGWLLHEARRRYRHVFDSPPPKMRLVAKDSASQERPLREGDAILEAISKTDRRPVIHAVPVVTK